MTTTPPEQPTESSQPAGVMRPGVSVDLARLPIPGNAELLVLILVEFIFAFLWWFRDDVTTEFWVTVTTVLTAFYILSRGIAKASRVLEQ